MGLRGRIGLRALMIVTLAFLVAGIAFQLRRTYNRRAARALENAQFRFGHEFQIAPHAKSICQHPNFVYAIWAPPYLNTSGV